MRVQRHHFQHLLYYRHVDFIVFMERYLICIGKILQRLALSPAAPVGSREVTAAFRYTSIRTV